jgi:hypothetical protein
MQAVPFKPYDALYREALTTRAHSIGCCAHGRCTKELTAYGAGFEKNAKSAVSATACHQTPRLIRKNSFGLGLTLTSSGGFVTRAISSKS